VIARHSRLVVALLAIPLALCSALTTQAAFAAENRPPVPVMTSPTANALDEAGGQLVASGTGQPGDLVFVNAFTTVAAYRAAIAQDEKNYQDFEAGHPLGGFGGVGARVDSAGHWTYTVDGGYLKRNVHNGVTYVAAFEVDENNRPAGEYFNSVYSPAVRVYTSWLHQPATPLFSGLAPSYIVQRQADGTLRLQGTGVPGAILIGFADATRAELNADLKRFAAQKQSLGTACPAGDAFCAIATVQSNGGWSFIVDAATVATSRDNKLYVSAAQAVNNGSPNRWSDPVAPCEITLAARVGSAASPSVFSSLVAFHWATFTPAHVALTAGAALVLTLLLGFPTTLVNSALEESYDERSKRLKPYADRLARALGRLRDWWKRMTARMPKFVGTVVWFFVAAIISGFADPTFGFNLESVRLLVSLFIAFVLLNVLGAYVTWWATVRTTHTRRPTFPPRPSNLLILAVTVIVARLIHLEPGLVFGAILGLDFGVKLAVHRKVRVILVGATYSAVIGILAWISYSLVSQTSTALGPVVLREFFSQLAVAGLASLPISLLPLKALNGETIFLWKRLAWGISYAIGLLIFLFVLLPMPFSWGGVSEPLIAWVALFVAYSIVAVVIWLAVRYHWFAQRKHPQKT
jgi:hypothetical protein